MGLEGYRVDHYMILTPAVKSLVLSVMPMEPSVDSFTGAPLEE
jgi:hypothetical protein